MNYQVSHGDLTTLYRDPHREAQQATRETDLCVLSTPKPRRPLLVPSGTAVEAAWHARPAAESVDAAEPRYYSSWKHRRV